MFLRKVAKIAATCSDGTQLPQRSCGFFRKLRKRLPRVKITIARPKIVMPSISLPKVTLSKDLSPDRIFCNASAALLTAITPLQVKALEDELDKWREQAETALENGGASLTKIREQASDALTNLRREVTNATSSAYRTYTDGLELIVDAAKATAHFAEREANSKLDSLEEGVKLMRKGRPLDAIWETTYTPLKNTSKNAALATQESIILNMAGSVAATTYGGPGGAAAYAAWSTYETTKDFGAALKAGIMAGAAAQASTAVAKMPTATATDIASKIAAKAALQKATQLAQTGKLEISQKFVEDVLVEVITTVPGAPPGQAIAVEAAQLMKEGDPEKIKARLIEYCAEQIATKTPNLTAAQVKALQDATRITLKVSLASATEDAEQAMKEAAMELRAALISTVARRLEDHLDPQTMEKTKREVVQRVIAATGSALRGEKLPDPANLLQSSLRDVLIQDQSAQEAMKTLGEAKARLEDAKALLSTTQKELENRLRQVLPELPEEVNQLQDRVKSLSEEIRTLDQKIPELNAVPWGVKLEAPTAAIAAELAVPTINPIADVVPTKAAAAEAKATATAAMQRLALATQTYQRTEKLVRDPSAAVVSPVVNALENTARENKLLVGVVGDWALSVAKDQPTFLLTEIGPDSQPYKNYQLMESERAKAEDNVARQIGEVDQLLTRLPTAAEEERTTIIIKLPPKNAPATQPPAQPSTKKDQTDNRPGPVGPH